MLGIEADADESSGVAFVPADVDGRGVITNEVFGAVLRSVCRNLPCTAAYRRPPRSAILRHMLVHAPLYDRPFPPSRRSFPWIASASW